MKKIVLFSSILLSFVLLLSLSQMTVSAFDSSGIVEKPQKTHEGGNNQSGQDEDNDADQQTVKETQQAERAAIKETQQAEKASAKETKQAEKASAKETKQADKQNKKQNFKGTIESASADAVTLLLKDGSSVTVAITADTRIKVPGNKAATAADLTAGMQAAVRAVMKEDVLTALSISVVPGKPVKVHRVGIVTEYTAGVSITIHAKDGSTTTFAIDPEVKILPAERADLLGVGSSVTIICPRNPSASSSDLPVAKGIVIHDKAATDVEDEELKEPVEPTEVKATEEPVETEEPVLPTATEEVEPSATPEVVEP